MKSKLTIAHLYPELLNLYADKGNILTLRRRLQWRHIDVDIVAVTASAEVRLRDYDLVLLGGGSDREQEIVGRTLGRHVDDWRAAVAAGLPVLAICGGYQLLGDYYDLANGQRVPGLGLLDMYTVPGESRLIGNVILENADCGTIVGFENHMGRTHHAYPPLGQVLAGHGNNGKDGKEGVRHLNLFGTYVHGPLLPKNPELADLVLRTALAYAGMPSALVPLDDALEQQAHDAFVARFGAVPS